MKVSVSISPEHQPPYAVIYTSQLTEEVQRIIDLFSVAGTPITAQKEEELVILRPEEIYLVRVENGETILYGKKETYRSRKRLYELSAQLGQQFMQISRSALVNLSHLDSLEPGFGGTMLLKLKNGSQEYISRTYLPPFKKYLGL